MQSRISFQGTARGSYRRWWTGYRPGTKCDNMETLTLTEALMPPSHANWNLLQMCMVGKKTVCTHKSGDPPGAAEHQTNLLLSG